MARRRQAVGKAVVDQRLVQLIFTRADPLYLGPFEGIRPAPDLAGQEIDVPERLLVIDALPARRRDAGEDVLLVGEQAGGAAIGAGEDGADAELVQGVEEDAAGPRGRGLCQRRLDQIDRLVGDHRHDRLTLRGTTRARGYFNNSGNTSRHCTSRERRIGAPYIQERHRSPPPSPQK